MKKPTEKQRLELEKRYNQYINDQAGNLHNQFVAFISESKIPLNLVLLVLTVLLEEVKEQIKKQYLGG